MFLDTGTLSPSAPLVPTQLSAAMACGYILFLLQKSKAVPWVTAHTAGINAAIRAVLSAAATLGITFQWLPADHALVIGNLSAAVILHGLWHWFSQYAAAQGFEKLLYVVPGQTAPQSDRAAVPAATTVAREPIAVTS